MKKNENSLYITFPARTENERLSRMIGAAFVADMNPTMEELDDVKTAISEAVTNAIIHGYEDAGEEWEKTEQHMVNAGAEGKKAEQHMANAGDGEDRGEYFVEMTCTRHGQEVVFVILDRGKGIEDVKQAMEPMFTTKKEENRSGMGFSFMEAFMDEVVVESEPGQGTSVTLKKRIGRDE